MLRQREGHRASSVGDGHRTAALRALGQRGGLRPLVRGDFSRKYPCSVLFADSAFANPLPH